MIRFAAFLLRIAGGRVEYRVQRSRPNKGGVVSSKDGTTLLRTDSFSDAKAKLKKVRVGDNQTVAIRLVAKVALRHGGVTIIGNDMEIDSDADDVNASEEVGPTHHTIDTIPGSRAAETSSETASQQTPTDQEN